MDTASTDVSFIAWPTIVDVTLSWSAGDTVLTCTPTTPFAANAQVFWSVADGGGLDEFGMFMTGSGGTSNPGNTNLITSFTLGAVYSYAQTSTAAPTLDTNAPYMFGATTVLASNRTATSILLTLPTGSVNGLVQNFVRRDMYYFNAFDTNLTSFLTNFPVGTYTFDVYGPASNQQLPLNLLPLTSQPPAPHLANYAAAQTVDAAQAFQLTWDAYQGGTAGDYIHVDIGNVFSSADVGTPGALPGTATSVNIPAGTLQPATSYEGTIGFYRSVIDTNGITWASTSYRASITQFTLTTTGSGTAPVLTNATYFPGVFSFNVIATPGQPLTVEWSTTMQPGSWVPIFTGNAPSALVPIVDPQPTSAPPRFYRARTP